MAIDIDRLIADTLLIVSGLSRQAIFNAVDASLKRLDLEYLDLLQIHRFDPFTPLEETMEVGISIVVNNIKLTVCAGPS